MYTLIPAAPLTSNVGYSATVVINDVEYGKGYGTTKKLAKIDAGAYP